MVLFFSILGCSRNSFPLAQNPLQCRIQSFERRIEENNGDWYHTKIEYIWDGNHDGNHDGNQVDQRWLTNGMEMKLKVDLILK